MIRLNQAIAAVMACTVVSGVAGGVVGVAVGTFAPAFVLWLQDAANGKQAFDPAEVGLGLGIVSGLLLGAAVGSFLIAVLTLRDAWLVRGGISVESTRTARESEAVLF